MSLDRQHADEDRRKPQLHRQEQNESPTRHARLLQLQRAAGNRAVASHLASHVASQGGTPVVQRFEAGHHEQVERQAMTSPAEPSATGAPAPRAFTDEEATMTYMGNWSRDLSQVLSTNPLTSFLGPQLIFELLNASATKKFGRELAPADFGVYSPREHIDNPAGQTNADLLRKSMNVKIRGQNVGTDEDIGGGSGEANLRARVEGQFAVNASGLPAYLGSSIQYVEEQLGQAANLGRQNPQALYHLGNGLHTVEDLFAHSNYVEMALGHHLDELPLPADVRTQLEGRKCGHPEHGEKGQDPIDTLSGKVGTGENARPILITGSFVTDDTKISIAEAVAVFLAELNPFTTSNKEWSQRTTRLLLERYHEIAEEPGHEISATFGKLGTDLADGLAKSAEASVAGEQPGKDAGLFDRAVAGVRGAVGSVVGSGIRAAGSLTSGVTRLMADGVNAFGKLPLPQVYDFVTSRTNALDAFFDKVDGFLINLPQYALTKAAVTLAREALRKALEALINRAVTKIGERLKEGFVEQNVQVTNIAQQIKHQTEAQIKNPEALAKLRAMPPNEQISALMNPEWCTVARISPEVAEKIASMMMAPDYIKAAASHSQIAKDHADSPFFGTAAALASLADTKLRDLMIAVWESEQQNQTAPELAKNYGNEADGTRWYVKRARPEPGKPEDEWSLAERAAEREAAKASPHYPGLKRRLEGEQLKRDGHLNEGHEDHEDHDHDAGTDMMSPEQRQALKNLAPVETRERGKEYAESHADLRRRGAEGAAETAERKALFDGIRMIFSHPYDTDWYHDTLLSWCKANPRLLAEYIAARNRGVMHHH